jgi:hypothetical protein
MEVAAWTQLGIHAKRMIHYLFFLKVNREKADWSSLATAVVIVNVLGYFDPLRAMIQNAVGLGFIKAQNEKLVIFVDCPPGIDPAAFDWGAAALSALDGWCTPGPGLFAWRLSSPNGYGIADY